MERDFFPPISLTQACVICCLSCMEFRGLLNHTFQLFNITRCPPSHSRERTQTRLKKEMGNEGSRSRFLDLRRVLIQPPSFFHEWGARMKPSFSLRSFLIHPLAIDVISSGEIITWHHYHLHAFMYQPLFRTLIFGLYLERRMWEKMESYKWRS